MLWEQDFWTEIIGELRTGLSSWLPAIVGALL